MIFAGFSLSEVLLASFVLTVGILSVSGLIVFSYAQSSQSQDLIIASELSQEGVELVRNLRDNNLAIREFQGAAPTRNVFDIASGFPNGALNDKCSLDYTMTVMTCGGGSPEMRLIVDDGKYKHGAGNAKFYRRLRIKVEGNYPKEGARILSFVTWKDPGNNLDGPNALTYCTIINKCVYTELFLTDWK